MIIVDNWRPLAPCQRMHPVQQKSFTPSTSSRSYEQRLQQLFFRSRYQTWHSHHPHLSPDRGFLSERQTDRRDDSSLASSRCPNICPLRQSKVPQLAVQCIWRQILFEHLAVVAHRGSYESDCAVGLCLLIFHEIAPAPFLSLVS